jgi:hypothetical protein
LFFLLANIVPFFDISLKGDTRNALILNGAIALSEYDDVVTLLIAERFLEGSDHWRSDDSLIATGLIFLSLAGRTGFGSAIAPEITLRGPISTSASSGNAELRGCDHDPRACAALPSVDGAARRWWR